MCKNPPVRRGYYAKYCEDVSNFLVIVIEQSGIKCVKNGCVILTSLDHDQLILMKTKKKVYFSISFVTEHVKIVRLNVKKKKN